MQQPVPILKAPGDNSAKRRKLILAGIVLLAAVSAVTFNLLSRGKAPAKPATSAIEQPLKPAPKKASDKTGSLIPSHTPQAIANNTGMPEAEGSAFDMPADLSDVTGSLSMSGKTDASVASLVAEPGPSATEAEMPPPEAGPAALREAAARGDAKAQFVVASRYLDGDGVEQDVIKAAHWYQLAATQGLAPAQYRVATLYERGKGAPKDVATALVWYERAATGGNVKAMHNAAVIAAGTEAGTPNYDKAFKWFKQAADRGLQDSQFNLAVLYQRGLGTTANPQEAYFWYSMAGANNDADAQARAAKLAATLKPEEVLALKSRVAGFAPLATDQNANFVAVTEESWKGGGTAGRPRPVPPPILRLPDNPVERVQKMLMQLGYNIGEPDGKMGGRTANAIRLFQLQSGLKVTGELSPELEAMLQNQAANSGA